MSVTMKFLKLCLLLTSIGCACVGAVASASTLPVSDTLTVGGSSASLFEDCSTSPCVDRNAAGAVVPALGQGSSVLLITPPPVLPTGGQVLLTEPGSTTISDIVFVNGGVVTLISDSPEGTPLTALATITILGTLEETGGVQDLTGFFTPAGLTLPAGFITVQSDVEATTPLPAALPLFATGLGALGLLGWRRKRKAATLAA